MLKLIKTKILSYHMLHFVSSNINMGIMYFIYLFLTYYSQADKKNLFWASIVIIPHEKIEENTENEEVDDRQEGCHVTAYMAHVQEMHSGGDTPRLSIQKKLECFKC